MRTRALMFESCFSLSKTRTQDDVCWNQMLPWRNATQMNGEKKRNTQQYHKSRLVSSIKCLKRNIHTYVKYINVYIYIFQIHIHMYNLYLQVIYHTIWICTSDWTNIALFRTHLKATTHHHPSKFIGSYCWFACNGEQEPINRTSWDAWLVLMDSGDSWMYRPLPTYP